MARRLTLLALVLPLSLGVLSCETFGGRRKSAPPPPPPGAPGEPLTPEPRSAAEQEEYLPVRKVADSIVVAAWAEPRWLPRGGGQAQILVRIQKQDGQRFAGVEVRLRASQGTLYSRGRVLVTDSQGMTRDQLTTRQTAVITLNAGGTRYRFQIPVSEPRP